MELSMSQSWEAKKPILPTTLRTRAVKRTNYRDPTVTSFNDLGFEITTTYKNGLPFPVTINLRSGLSQTIPPLTANWRDVTCFTVHVRYRFSKNVKIDIQRILDEVDENSDEERKALKLALQDAKTTLGSQHNECVVTYEVFKHDLEQNGGSVYLEQLDITICQDDGHTNLLVLHPESIEGKRERVRQIVGEGFNLKLEINDPFNIFGERFINVLGNIYRVKLTRDTTKPPGVYRTSTPTVDDPTTFTEYFTFEEVNEKIQLFHSAAEAKALGDMSTQRKKELEDLQHQYKIDLMARDSEHRKALFELEREVNVYKTEKLQAESTLSKLQSEMKEREIQYDKEAKERDARLKEREVQYAKEKAEREYRLNVQKDYYEARSYERKDSSEIIKWIPPMVVGAGLILSKFL